MMLLFLLAIGCAPVVDEFSDGWDDGCDAAIDQGYTWGGEDATDCFEPDDTPPPGNSAGSDYDEGFDGGYESCYEDAYNDGYAEMMEYLGGVNEHCLGE